MSGFSLFLDFVVRGQSVTQGSMGRYPPRSSLGSSSIKRRSNFLLNYSDQRHLLKGLNCLVSANNDVTQCESKRIN